MECFKLTVPFLLILKYLQFSPTILPKVPSFPIPTFFARRDRSFCSVRDRLDNPTSACFQTHTKSTGIPSLFGSLAANRLTLRTAHINGRLGMTGGLVNGESGFL